MFKTFYCEGRKKGNVQGQVYFLRMFCFVFKMSNSRSCSLADSGKEEEGKEKKVQDNTKK